ncbi:MAG: Asp23/Gls24 family envelope stress response protein [Lachnospiraceae bacterium]|nr:Asp23/Gls24 family envelope stress response protein [Lachnospiraceae bacterium]
MEKQIEKNVCLTEGDEFGTVKIANDVVAMITALAVTEVEGVSHMVGTIPNEIMSKVGMKKQTKGVKVDITEKNVSIDVAVNLLYGYNIPTTCSRLQDKIKNAIETMTGLNVTDVNVRIVGIEMPE